MKFWVAPAVFALAVLFSGAATVGQPTAVPTADVAAASGVNATAASTLLRRMGQINAKLHSYTANITLDVKMRSFPYLSPELTGSVFFKQPNKRAVVFDTVPALAEQAKKLYPKLDEPIDWLRINAVTALSDEGGVTLFRLIPRKNGRVEHLDVKVDDASATVTEYTWTYKDGGFVTFSQTFKTIGGNYLPDKLTGHVELPSYKADVTSALSNYKLNVAIADSIFEEK
jgi:hypothetical protein